MNGDPARIIRPARVESQLAIELGLDDRRAFGPAEGPTEVARTDDWIAPAFWDIQTNGRWGSRFRPGADRRAGGRDRPGAGRAGHGAALPDLDHGPRADLRHGVRTIAEACDQSPESPGWSGHSSRRALHLGAGRLPGAHPARGRPRPRLGRVPGAPGRRGRRIALVTLAPERPARSRSSRGPPSGRGRRPGPHGGRRRDPRRGRRGPGPG